MLIIDSIISTGNEVATLHEATTYFRSEQSGGIEDTLIMSLVQGAREMIEKYIDRSLVAHDIEIFVDQFKGFLPYGPVDRDSIVITGGENITITGNKYPYIQTEVPLSIKYSTEAYLSEDLKNAVLELAFYWYERGEFAGGEIPMKVKAVINRHSRLNFVA